MEHAAIPVRQSTAEAVCVGIGLTVIAGMTGWTGWAGPAAVLAVVVTVALSARATARYVGLCAISAVAAGLVLGVVTSGIPALFWNALAGALLVAVAAVLTHGLVSIAQLRREFNRRGWAVARTAELARDHDVATALSRERERMAAEVHDRIGHRLTLVSVGLGGLEVASDLSPDHRATVARLREGVAEATQDVSGIVRLLREPGQSATVDPWDEPLEALVQRARDHGLPVHASLHDVDELGPTTRAAVARIVTETLTNAGKHAPGSRAEVHLRVAAGQADLRVVTRSAARPAQTGQPVAKGGTDTAPGPGTGSGLLAIRERVRLLGGQFAVHDGSDHVVEVTLPADAQPVPRAQSGGEGEAGATRLLRGETVDVWRWTLGMALVLSGAVFLAGAAYVTHMALTSVLPTDAFQQVRIGAPRAEVQSWLPPNEMLDAPRNRLEVPAGAQCYYYRSAVSLIESVDVHRVCFRGDRVVAVDTIPPR